MKRQAHDGLAGWPSRGPTSEETSNSRLTGADGTLCAKWTRSPMNVRGPDSGKYRPFGSCIHAPPGDDVQGLGRTSNPTACLADLPWILGKRRGDPPGSDGRSVQETDPPGKAKPGGMRGLASSGSQAMGILPFVPPGSGGGSPYCPGYAIIEFAECRREWARSGRRRSSGRSDSMV